MSIFSPLPTRLSIYHSLSALVRLVPFSADTSFLYNHRKLLLYTVSSIIFLIISCGISLLFVLVFLVISSDVIFSVVLVFLLSVSLSFDSLTVSNFVATLLVVWGSSPNLVPFLITMVNKITIAAICTHTTPMKNTLFFFSFLSFTAAIISPNILSVLLLSTAILEYESFIFAFNLSLLFFIILTQSFF